MRSAASGSISGKVVFAASNRPAERVRVDLILPTGAWAANSYTDWSGEFGFDELHPGDYRVVVDQPGYERVEENVDMDFASRWVHLRLNEVRPQVNGEIGSAVSVRELSIPVKARKAFKNGLGLLATKDTPGALKSFEQAVKRFPAYYEAYHQIGMAYLELGHREDAEQAFKRSIELSAGRYAPAQIALGAVFCDRGKFIEAERSIREGLELDDAPWLSHYLLAKALFGLGRWDEAERSIHEVIARKSDLPESYLLLSGIHFNQDNYSALLDDLNDYLRLDAESSTAAEVRTLREKVKLALAKENHAAASLTR
jgi:tetratricopeptide (TPR) repeat protein